MATDLLDTPEAGGTAIRGTALRTLGYGVGMALALAAAPLLTRHLGIVDFGRYSQVVALVALVGTITEAGLSALGVRELATLRGEQRARLMRNLLGVRLALTLGGLGGALAFAALAGYGAELVLGTALAGLGLLLGVTQGAYATALGAELRLGWITVADIVRQLVIVALVVALVLAGADVVSFLGVPIAAGLVTLAITAWLVHRTVPLGPALELRAWREILRETLPLAASGAIYNLYFRLVILLMSVMTTGLETGFFALAFRIMEVLATVPFLLVGSLLPLMARAARDDPARFAYGFRRTFEVAMITGLGMSLATFLGAPAAIHFLSDTPDPTPVDVLRIQAVALLATFINVALGMALIALRHHRDIVIASLVTLGVTLVAALALLPSTGARGGALASTAGEVALVFAYAVLLMRARPDLRPDFRVLPRALVAVGAGVGTAYLIEIPLVPELARAIAGTAVYLVVLACLRAIPPELTRALLPWSRPAT